jgi:uncharacterized protein (UPF0548 family)
MVKLLSAARVAELSAQELTYPPVEDRTAVPPPGFAYFSRTHLLADSVDFPAAGEALMRWQVQARSGLRISASSVHVGLGVVVVMRLGVGAVALSIPCRVVDVVNEPDRIGFSYGSLSGHPESGEESFLLERDADGVASFTVSAFSRPASRLARMGGPITSWAQRFMTGRYLRALG